MRGTLPLEDLGFTTADFTEVRELWMDEVITVGQSGLPYNVPSADARVFRFTKSNPSGIEDVGWKGKPERLLSWLCRVKSWCMRTVICRA